MIRMMKMSTLSKLCFNYYCNNTKISYGPQSVASSYAPDDQQLSKVDNQEQDNAWARATGQDLSNNFEVIEIDLLDLVLTFIFSKIFPFPSNHQHVQNQVLAMRLKCLRFVKYFNYRK